MTRTVRGEDVEVELGEGTVTFRWPSVDVALGPCSAAASTLVAGATEGHTSAGTPGAWRVETADAFGRDGVWARWVVDDGITLSVHVPLTGTIAVVETAWRPNEATTLDRLTPLAGSTNLAVARRVVDGYDSWAYSGVRGEEPGASFWNTLLVSDDGRAIGVHALGASRLCTRITWDAPELRVDAGATPPLHKVEGTWGYLVGEPPPLDLAVAADDTVVSEPVAVAAGDDALLLAERLAGLAGATMNARTWSGGPIHGWESWYHYGLLVTAEDVLTNARLLRERYRDRPGFDLVQVDDGWQVTYGAWSPNDRFPDDLAALTAELHAMGARPGLWIAPFRVQPGAPGIAHDHPDWCVRGPDGEPWHEDRHGTWALDASHPGACAWIRDLGGQVRAWGFEMVKVDFCYLGAVEGGRHDASVTSIEALRRGMTALVDGLGDDVYVLGCGMPVLPAVGLCHANRVGHDVAMPRVFQDLGHPADVDWTGMRGVRVQARNVAARWAQHGRWYASDPEVVMAWGSDGTDPAGYPTEVARMMATLALVTGGPYLLADDLGALDAVERAVLEHPPLLSLLDDLEGGTETFRPIDLLAVVDPPEVAEEVFSVGPGVPSRWLTHRQGRQVLACFNWGDEPATHALPPGLVEGPGGAAELWTGALVDGPNIVVPPRAVRVVVSS